MTLPSILLQAPAGGMDFSIIFLMFGIFLVIQFVIMGPRQKKKEKEKQAFIEGLAAGSKLVTSSGIHGKLIRLEDNTMIIEVDSGVKIKIEKNFINFEMTKELNKG